MYCGHCGSQAAEGAAACATCGERLVPSATPASSTHPRSERPAGVTALAVLGFLAAAFMVLGALIGVTGATLLGAALGDVVGEAAAGGAIGAAFALLVAAAFLAFALLLGVTSWGLWAGKVWGWAITLVIHGLSALSDLYGLVQGEFPQVASLLLSGVVVWYLLQPRVKAYFRVGGA